MAEHLDLRTTIGDRTVPRGPILEWELGRACKVFRFLTGAPAPQGQGVDELSDRVFRIKREIGPEALEKKLAWRVRASDAVMVAASKASRGERVVSTIRVQSPVGTAEPFCRWFVEQSDLPFSDAMLAACPDHYVLGEGPGGSQKAIETTGGSPLPTRFFIDYDDQSSLVAPPSPDFPIQLAGVARTKSGAPVGGVRHQFRDLEQGFEAWLTVEFPKGVPGFMVHQHRWHLGCEFGNWIEFHQEIATTGSDGLREG